MWIAHASRSLTVLASSISAVDPTTQASLVQYGIPAALTALIAGLVWILKWQATQISEQGKSMLSVMAKATEAMATQTETNRSVASALQTIANRQEVAAQVAAQVATELAVQKERGGGNRRAP